MIVVSVINYKGGVGKTTTTANVAAQLAWQGYKVLAIDLDPQTNLTFSFLRVDEWSSDFADNRTIKQLFDSLLDGKDFDISGLIYEPSRAKQALQGRGKLEIISSHLGLINVDLELATLLNGASLRKSKQNFIKAHSRLADSLEKIDDDAYDVVLIDCPPNFNIVTKTAIVASDYILVPTRPDFLSTLGIDYLIRNVASLVSDYNDYAREGQVDGTPEIEPATIGVVFNMVQERNGPISAQENYMQQLRRQSGLYIFNNYVKQNNTIFADAPERGVPVVLTGTTNPTFKSVVAGLEAVTGEFIQLVGL